LPRGIKSKKNDGVDDDNERDDSCSGSNSTPFRSRTPSSTPPNRPYKSNSTKTTDDDDEDGCGPTGNKAYFTFILHYNNLSETWKTDVAGLRKGCPSFISFDEGDHIHVLFDCSGGGGNAARTRGKCKCHHPSMTLYRDIPIAEVLKPI
jgi:hypothetical protein